MKHLKHLKTLMMVMILSLLTTVAISCAEEKEGSKDSGPVTCRVSVSSGEGGTAETTETEVMQGWEVTLTAKPEETYRFVNWTVNNKEVSRENPYIAIVNTSTQFKANFEKDNYALKVTAGEGGSVKSTSEGELLKGTKVTLTATPQEGYSFVNWTVEGKEVSTQNPYTTTITEDIEIKANFKETKGIENGYTWIDLGLPSGLKWATCNVGATLPEEYGDYFAWGETSPKTTYDWSTYKYCNGTSDSMTKYCTYSRYGIVDNKTTLELSDDAARVNWGGSWRMPTKAEQDELRNTNNCTWNWTTQNGVNGYKVTSKKNGNSIFLPAAGYRHDSLLGSAGRGGYYWSSSLDAGFSDGACNLYFYSSYVDGNNYYRYYGHSVRPVCE